MPGVPHDPLADVYLRWPPQGTVRAAGFQPGNCLLSLPHQAPSPEAMRQACLCARQFWHLRYPDLAIRLHIEDVPQFVPGVGRTGESYRVGAIQLVAAGDFLTVYLDTIAGRVLVEQPLLEIPVVDDVEWSRNLGPGRH